MSQVSRIVFAIVQMVKNVPIIKKIQNCLNSKKIIFVKIAKTSKLSKVVKIVKNCTNLIKTVKKLKININL